MNRNNVFTVIRVAAGLVCWFTVTKLYGAYVDPLLEGRLPVMIRQVISSMIVPYTIGLGVFFLAVTGMPVKSPDQSLKPGAGTLLKWFVIQTGLAMPPLFIINTVCNLLGIKTDGISSEELFGNIWFYIVLLLIFNPIFEELLFRKFVLGRLDCLGFKGSIICSAVLFALPHVISQGPAQMFYTFALGLVWAYVTLKTGRLWPAIVLHSLSNLYGAFIPMAAAQIMPLLSVLFVAFTVVVFVPLTIVFLTVNPRKRANKPIS